MAATDVEQAVEAALKADSGVTALVPATSIKTGFAGQSLPTPYIVHFPVVGMPTQLLGELAAMKIWTHYQVSVFSDSYSNAKAVSLAVVAALGRLTTSDGVQFMLSSEPRFMGTDPTLTGPQSALAIGMYHLMTEFTIAEAL